MEVPSVFLADPVFLRHFNPVERDPVHGDHPHTHPFTHANRFHIIRLGFKQNSRLGMGIIGLGLAENDHVFRQSPEGHKRLLTLDDIHIFVHVCSRR